VSMKERYRFMHGIAAWVGFRQEVAHYDRQEHFVGETTYPHSQIVRSSPRDAIN